jgi:hypothetical protein
MLQHISHTQNRAMHMYTGASKDDYRFRDPSVVGTFDHLPPSLPHHSVRDLNFLSNAHAQRRAFISRLRISRQDGEFTAANQVIITFEK